LECLAGLHASYLVGATKSLTKAQFNDRFSKQLTLPVEGGIPFLDNTSDWSVSNLARLGADFNVLRMNYKRDVENKIGPDGKYFEEMKQIRGEIQEYFASRRAEPVTGDSGYFINSRFYIQIYTKSNSPPPPDVQSEGFWQGENTIAYIHTDGRLFFTGLGLGGLKTETELNDELKKQLYAGQAAVSRFLATIEGRPEVIAAASKYNVTTAEYAKRLFDHAANIDIGMFRIAKAVI
jgi:hypothetical protein